MRKVSSMRGRIIWAWDAMCAKSPNSRAVMKGEATSPVWGDVINEEKRHLCGSRHLCVVGRGGRAQSRVLDDQTVEVCLIDTGDQGLLGDLFQRLVPGALFHDPVAHRAGEQCSISSPSKGMSLLVESSL
jgi:hypothetical protein